MATRKGVALSHGHTVGGAATSTYRSWQAMRARCLNPAHEKFKNYGAKGITVCERWLNSFENFLADMGERPKGCTLDRHPDRKGNYTHDNCRWATPKQQTANRDPWTDPRSLATHCPNGHEWTPENTIHPRRNPKHRRCRICQNAAARASYDKAKATSVNLGGTK